ncbi:hypothetical protein BDF20DRAFT_336769 [Mycotypha africana]|uniref:uncharacterized protein n=1 Tax=Mycotypha africana TaxID=64632 RepID=UPI002301C591|nr:uncharacterized protein BDF20DRAFT_336769 [Mycotypha africana]KAI8988525.1 hypothetical protein BDF20DRAFT_336769 [Mycotypha africana]
MRFFSFLSSIIYLFTLIQAEQFKRTPPFGKNASDVSKKLGDYTHSHEKVDKSTYSCYPIGECEICSPLEQKTQPYCADYGNKQAIRCEWNEPEIGDSGLSNHTLSTFDEDDAITLPSYRACPRVRQVERARFLKFEGFNFSVAVLSIMVFIWRQKKMAHEQYQNLARRIGVTTV